VLDVEVKDVVKLMCSTFLAIVPLAIPAFCINTNVNLKPVTCAIEH